jgi:hypothetical protein
MRTARRPGRFVLAGSLALTLGLAGIAAAWTRPTALAASDVETPIHYSHYGLGTFTVPAGVPVRIVLKNEDPIDHEWIVGDAALHERHRTGTEPVHDSRPTEVTIPAYSERVTTVSTRPSPRSSLTVSFRRKVTPRSAQ